MSLKDSPYLDKLQRDIIASERAKAFEEAAKVAERYQSPDWDQCWQGTSKAIAQAIRALATGEGR